jgi:prefoldin subunit 5
MMKLIDRNDFIGTVIVQHNGVLVRFNYQIHVCGKFTLTDSSLMRAQAIGIGSRLEETLNGSTEYLDEEEKEEEKPSDQYNEMLKARDILTRWLEANKNKRCVKGSE